MGQETKMDEAQIEDHLGEMVRETIKEALIEMYLAGVSVRLVEDITEALLGSQVSPGSESNLNEKIYEAWRHQPIAVDHPYLYLDGIVMSRSRADEVRNVSLLVASAVNAEGYREILEICEGANENQSGWSAFLRLLVDRGLSAGDLRRCEAKPASSLSPHSPDDAAI